MAEVPLNILSTPLQIRDCVHHIFPQAIVTSDRQEGRNKVIIKISQIQPELILTTMVDTELFQKPLIRWIVPGIGTFYAVGAVYYRWQHGQNWRAVGEVASGVVGLIPGGSPAKVLLDLSIMGGDVKELMAGRHGQNDLILIRDLNDAYALLGLPRDGHPTQEQAHAAFLAQQQRVAEDHLGQLGPLYQQYAHTLQVAVNAARDFIYAHHNWRE